MLKYHILEGFVLAGLIDCTIFYTSGNDTKYLIQVIAITFIAVLQYRGMIPHPDCDNLVYVLIWYIIFDVIFSSVFIKIKRKREE